MIIGRDTSGVSRSLLVGEIPYANPAHTLRMAKLHMDATRSGALFAERLVLVERVTDAIILGQLRAAWAGGDLEKEGFVDALTMTVIGTKVGPRPIELVATSGHEIVQQVAILRNSDTPDGSPPELPAWITDRDPIVKAFVSHPTLEQRFNSAQGSLPSLLAASTAPEPGSRWSARSEARTDDLDAGEERSRMAGRREGHITTDPCRPVSMKLCSPISN